jgi:tetraacyldisaccharide 4'-kinase
MSLFGGKPVLIARLEPSSPPPAGPQVGFAGIGKPEKFERALIAAGCDLRDFAPLADHQPFSDSLLTFLERRAGVLGAGLVTTEKDWVRLPPAWRERIAVWPARARFDDSAALDALLATTLRLP